MAENKTPEGIKSDYYSTKTFDDVMKDYDVVVAALKDASLRENRAFYTVISTEVKKGDMKQGVETVITSECPATLSLAAAAAIIAGVIDSISKAEPSKEKGRIALQLIQDVGEMVMANIDGGCGNCAGCKRRDEREGKEQ